MARHSWFDANTSQLGSVDERVALYFIGIAEYWPAYC